MKRFFMPVVMIVAFLFSLGVTSAQQIYSPARGTVERKAILNAIRPMMEARLGAPVEFVVNRMKVYQDWAWVVVEPQRPGGAPIDTKAPGVSIWDDDGGLTTYVLLRQAYGQWNLIDHAIGPTDVFWDGDPLYRQFPRAFTYSE